MNNKMSIERIADRLDTLAEITPDKSKMAIERIADALENLTKTAAMSEKSTLERIADAVEDYSGGGGGSGDLTYANVKANYIGDYSPTGFSYVTIRIQNDAYDDCIGFTYSDGYGIPISDLGSVTNIKVPVHKNYKTNLSGLQFDGDGDYLIIETIASSVVSGDAEIDENNQLLISGDCELNLTLVYAD